MLLQGCRSATPHGLRATCTEACSIAMDCPDPLRAYRSEMPLVDTCKIGRGEPGVSAHMLLQRSDDVTQSDGYSGTRKQPARGSERPPHASLAGNAQNEG